MDDGETFGEMLRRLRGSRSLSAIGHLANISKGHVHDLENARRAPSRSVLVRLDEILRANGELIEAYESHAGLPDEVRPGIAEKICLRTLEAKALQESEEEATQRRRLLRLAAGAGFGGALGFNESVRQMLDLTTNIHRSIEDWDIARTDHLHALRTRPPAQVVADLAIDLHDLARHLELASPADLPELYRTAALLSCIQANALTRLADHGAAIRWWRTARHTADASRDPTLRLVVRAEEAGHGLYGQRSPEAVLNLIQNARRLPAGQRSILKLLTAEAKALSLLGHHKQATETLNALMDLTETSDADRWGFWKDDQIYFTASWVHAAAGRTNLAAEARDQVLRLTRDYQYPVNVNLHGAMCEVLVGGVDEGMRNAAQVVMALPTPSRSNHVMETARMVLKAVPPDQRARPAVGEFRSLLVMEA